MKKLLLAGAFIVSGLLPSVAQTVHFCGADEMIKKAMELDPGYITRLAQLEQFTSNYIQQQSGQKTSGSVQYVIPVVFHIIHNYGTENISKAQVLDAVDIMNKSFQKWYSDSLLVASAFRPIIADVEVEFRLAQLDPQGNCTDGITRTVSQFTYDASDNVKTLITWPSNKYFNIWVVANIASGAAGYAYYPGVNASIDGVVMLNTYTGGIGTSSGSNYAARSLTHEAGHWLNLPHTWGGTNSPGLAQNCNNDDFVQDTPNTIGVANFSCDTSQVSCGSLDNVQNYMDYASCHYMFTEGQKARMHAALNSSAGQRNNLHSQNNMIATGTNDGFVPGACLPIVDFNPNVNFVCAGTSINFYDLSWRADPTGWQWDFPGGTPAVSFDQNPVIQYNTPGVYDVTLTVSNGAGNTSITRTALVLVGPATGANALPFQEDFENTGPIPSGADWIVENPAGNAWALSNAVSVSGSNAMRLLNHSGNPTGTTDAFITPGYDLTNITNATVTFQLAFAARSSTSTDRLNVYASNDCGQQWNVRYTKTGLNLTTAGIITTSFTPTGSQWRQESLSLNGTSYNNKPSVRLKFEYTHGNGNNIYIDDINITGTSTVGIDDVEFLATLSVYPNPTSGVSNIYFSLSEAAIITAEVTDIAGRLLSVLENSKLGTGEHRYSFGDDYAPGIYLVRIKVNDNHLTQKVIITK